MLFALATLSGISYAPANPLDPTSSGGSARRLSPG